MALNTNSNTEALTLFDFSTSPSQFAPSLSVLIADDDPPSRMLLSASLKQWGYQVVEAADGEEAWKIMQEANSPRILILDWIMPKMDGIRLCTKLRKEIYDSSSFYIIMLSQLSGNSNTRIAIDAGANEFLSKPFDYQELRSRLLAAARIITYLNALVVENKKAKEMNTHIRDLSALLFKLNEEMNSLLHRGDPVAVERFELLYQTLKRAVALIKECNR